MVLAFCEFLSLSTSLWLCALCAVLLAGHVCCAEWQSDLRSGMLTVSQILLRAHSTLRVTRSVSFWNLSRESGPILLSAGFRCCFVLALIDSSPLTLLCVLCAIRSVLSVVPTAPKASRTAYVAAAFVSSPIHRSCSISFVSSVVHAHSRFVWPVASQTSRAERFAMCVQVRCAPSFGWPLF